MNNNDKVISKYELGSSQEEIFVLFKNQFGNRITNEEVIKEIITHCSCLINEMKEKNEVDLHQRFITYLQNISFSMNMLDDYRPKDVNKIKKEFIFLALIQYVYYCENLVTLFEEFITKNTIYNYVMLKDIKNELRKSKKNALEYTEIFDLATKRKKNERNVNLTDFKSAFGLRYKKYWDSIFKGRIIPHLRNAIAHNKFNLNEEEQMIKGIYNPNNKKEENISFLKFIDLHDTVVMIYLCLVKELVMRRSDQKIPSL